MSFDVNSGILVLSALCIAISLYDFTYGNRKRAGIFLIGILVFLGVLYLTTGFPNPSGTLAFGGTFSVLWAIFAMFAGVVLGMISQYIWSKPSALSWLDVLRPIVISPLVLLPLIGSLEGSQLESIQLVSLILLAFQNGFFWQQVLKDAVPKSG